jgi:hypothetical protein
MNEKLTKDKHHLVEFFEELKVNFIKILNELAKLYVFHHPDKMLYEGKGPSWFTNS